MDGHLLEKTLDPGSDAWLATISASQIAAIVGLSPWHTAHELWHQKKGTLPREKQTTAQRRGHRQEPVIRDITAEAHPDWAIVTTGTWRNNQRLWQTANPDGLIFPDRDLDGPPWGLEIKTTGDMRWWAAGIPDYYQCQAQWQMATLGMDRVLFAVAGGFELIEDRAREFWCDRDEQVIEWLVREALQFLDMLALDLEPDPDYGAACDRDVLRHKHPAIVDAGVELPDELAIPFLTALGEAKAVDGAKAKAAAEVAAFLGDGRKATWRGVTLGGRKAGRDGRPPSFSAAPKLADKAHQLLESKETAA